MKKIVIIGGGFFGMYLSEHFAKQGHHVMLIEKESDFMQRASYVNQARVHNGYHYPRSILTALRSRISFPRFIEEFGDCIDDTFDKYYMISRILSKTSTSQFKLFCQRIGADCESAPQKIIDLANPQYIESVFSTKEFAFDAEKIKVKMYQRIQNAGVTFHLNQKVQSIVREKNTLKLQICSTNNLAESEIDDVGAVFNCTYSMINQILNDSNLELIPLKHELSEMCLVEVPHELKNLGITVMDGPFFSVMPFPSKGLHSFSHVRYTPHYEWYDAKKEFYSDAHLHYNQVIKKTSWEYMIHDAQRYLPILSECRYDDSMWEVKTILSTSESNDSRPILFKPNYGLQGLHHIMGGKIDNVYDVIDVVEKTGIING